MNYQTYRPHPDLEALVKCFWTLEIPAESNAPRQRIIPDGTIEMAFILGDDIKRFISETHFIIQPRSILIGQITEPFYIQPIGQVNTFAIRFYPFGFANFVSTPIKELSNKETPIELLFGNKLSQELEQKIVQAKDTSERIEIMEKFLISTLNSKTTIDKLVRTTIDALVSTGGNSPINSILKNDISKRRQLERSFAKQIGLSPKQLGKVIRFQAALKTILSNKTDKYIQIAYETDYYDQAHFIRDFKEFTGTTPAEFLEDDKMMLSSLIYKNE